VPPFLSARDWRLSSAGGWLHGRGGALATEAAIVARDDAFDRLALPEVVSIIHPAN
jgi:RimJ/RimL family protein N-acetyltransferase